MKQRVGRKETVFCVTCQGDRDHFVAATYAATDGNEDITIWWDHDILTCGGCRTVTFRTEMRSTEDAPGEREVRYYPPRWRHVIKEKTYTRLPPKLQRIYRETVSAFNRQIYTLAAAGLRALVEGICTDRRIKSGLVPDFDPSTRKPKRDSSGNVVLRRSKNLDGKIEGMAEGGIITKNHVKVLHEFRFLGNEAVHDLQMPSVENLEVAINIMEHTITHVYELSKEAAKIRKRVPKH